MVLGYLSLILHGHLPWVLNHGVWPHGEIMLYEAASETYCPTLSLLTDFSENNDYQNMVTIGLTPVLTEQLANEKFKKGFIKYLDDRIKASDKDSDEFKATNNQAFLKLSKRWSEHYRSVKEQFIERFNRDLVSGYKNLQNKHAIEIITSGITHGYLPLLGKEETVNAQIKAGQDIYKKHYGGKNSDGIWIPEMAYRPSYRWKNPINGEEFERKGIEDYLSLNGIKYTILNTPLLNDEEKIGNNIEDYDLLKNLWKRSQTRKKTNNYNLPLYQPYLFKRNNSGNDDVYVYIRDYKTGAIVWSGDIGFPGDEYYLEFHKKHFPSGNRYWRVTGTKVDLGEKQIYIPDKVIGRLDENASYFAKIVKETLIHYYEHYSQPGIIVSPYDFELFGHWWFEGVGFIDRLIKEFQEDSEYLTITASKYVENFPQTKRKSISLPEGSWGKSNFHWNWINPDTLWCWEKIYECEKLYVDEVNLFKNTINNNEIKKRILNQLGRELFLLSASDWEFLISTYSAKDYAEARINAHYNNFKQLYHLLKNKQKYEKSDLEIVSKIEKIDDLAMTEDVFKWFEMN